MRFFMNMPHWLEALTPPLERHLQSLADAVSRNLQVRPGSGLEDELTAFSQVTYERSVAEGKLKEIVARYAGDPKAHQYLGEFYNRCQEYEKAIEAFKQGIELDAGNALLYWDLALAYQQADKRRAAADSLEKAVSLGLDASRQRYAATLLEALQRTEP
jgi:tetratricopeptide (TPR) repeat protein